MTTGESLFWWLPAIACGIAVYHDLRSREIPDWLPIALILLFPIRLLIVSDVSSGWQHLMGGVLALVLGLIIGRGDRFGGGEEAAAFFLRTRNPHRGLFTFRCSRLNSTNHGVATLRSMQNKIIFDNRWNANDRPRWLE